jgi:ribosomal protein S18 acetylase RimI-like enzyme
MSNRIGSITIREAELGDAENIAVLKQQVWISTYAVEGIRKEFSDYVLSEFTLPKVQQGILDGGTKTLIAVVDGHVIGCVEVVANLVCPVQPTAGSSEISVLYVLERFCGIGVGQLLLDEAFVLMRSFSVTTTWLTVYHQNDRAINFYRKNHFEQVGTTNFEMGGNEYENYIMIRQL